jgi:hypothetical protein
VGRSKIGFGKVSRFLVFIPALLGFLFTSSSADADAFGVWEFSKSCLASEGGSVEEVEGGFRLVGADGGTCAGKSHYVRMQATIPEDTDELGFQWAYQTNDGSWYDPPQIILNGVITKLTNENNATGSGLIQVEPGDVFAFQQYSTDSCCQPGLLTITGLTLGLGEWVSTTSSTITTTTSTSTVPSTTVPVINPTITTVPETTTTSSTTTTSLPQTVVQSTTTAPPQTTTSVQETISTVTSTSSTTTSTSTTVAPTTTSTTVAPTTTTTVYVPPATTTTVYVPPATTSTVPETTTTTTTEPEPAPTTTLPPPIQTTSTTSTTTTNPPTTTTTQPPVTTTQPDVTTTLQNPTDQPKPLTQTELLNTIQALSEASTEAIQGILQATLTKELDTSQATLLIATPAVLENITSTQAEQLFEQITPTELSPDEAEAVVAAVQEAPQEVREAFESTLNIFQGFADTYVPLNSTVPVSTRRALIAVGAVFLTVAPAPARRIR